MSWNKLKIFNTVKCKVALWYALLFILSSMICFYFMYANLRDNLLSKENARLEMLARRVSNEFLTGSRYKRLGRDIPLSRIPAYHYALFQRKFPDLKPLLAFQNPSPDQMHYNLVAESGGHVYILRLDSNDKIYSQQVGQDATLPFVRKTFVETTASLGGQNVFFCLFDKEGARFLESPNLAMLNPPVKWAPVERETLSDIGVGGATFRIIRFPIRDGVTGVIGCNLSNLYESLSLFILISFTVMSAVLLPGTFAGWLIAGRFVAGIRRVSNAALQIAQGDFSQRVAPGNEGAEIDQLVAAFNKMSENTENLLTELKNVSDNVAHDLRTPLTRIRTIAEITISGPQTLEAYREAIIDVAEDCNDMIGMINAMLEITRIETHIAPLKTETFDFCGQLRQAYELFQFQAEDKNLTFELHLPEEPVMLNADKLKIQRLTSNLLDNAIKFTPENGRVSLKLETVPGEIHLIVSDTGCGIPDEAKAHVFKRFYRSDKSRTMPGNGLGLSMVQAIVQVHKGRIEIQDTEGGGTTFLVIFPAIPG